MRHPQYWLLPYFGRVLERLGADSQLDVGSSVLINQILSRSPTRLHSTQRRTSCDLSTTRQASKRPWRPGVPSMVQIYFGSHSIDQLNEKKENQINGFQDGQFNLVSLQEFSLPDASSTHLIPPLLVHAK